MPKIFLRIKRKKPVVKLMINPKKLRKLLIKAKKRILNFWLNKLKIKLKTVEHTLKLKQMLKELHKQIKANRIKECDIGWMAIT